MTAPQPAPRPVAEVRFERPQRSDSEHGREAPQRMAPPPPAPAPAAATAPAPRPAPAPRGDDRKRGDDHERKSER
jgi:hypothetical protein